MSEHGLTAENFLLTLPPALAADENMRALAQAVAQVLARRPGEIEQTLIYPRISRLDGPLLDILARDFKVDWWDSDYSLEEKRRTLEGSWQVHKTLGTRAAVEQAISAIYPNTRVQEWFEYGGGPYRFRLEIDITHDTKNSEKQARALARLGYYKNLRSHMESLAYVYRFEAVVLNNRQAFSFLSALLRWGVKRAMESRLAALAMRSGLAYCGECGQGFTVCQTQRQRGAFLLSGAVVRLHGSNNLDITNYALDGRRRLDGSWRLGDRVNPGIRFRALHAAGWRRRFEGTSRACLCLGAGIRSPTGLSAGVRLRAPLPNCRRAEAKTVKFHMSVGESFALRAYEVLDALWQLDGAYRLDGTRKLNAKIERREL